MNGLNSRKRILFLAPRVPHPPDKGDKIRTCNVLRHMVSRHEVYCASFVTSLRDRVHADIVESMCADAVAYPWRKLSALIRGGVSLLGGGTVTQAAYRNPELLQRIANWGKFDCVYAFSVAMAPYALAAQADRRMLDLCDADSEKWFDYARCSAGLRRLLYQSEGKRVRRLELEWLRKFDVITVITDRERKLIDPFGARDRLHVVSNGVEIVSDSQLPSANGPLVVFTGAMDYPPNADAVTWFTTEIWPLVRARVPIARFQVIGRQPTRAVWKLASLDGIEIVGEVPEVQPYLGNCRVVVAPLRIARGLPNKVLEAMAARRPVVTTSIVGAAIRARDGQELLIADSAAEFATRVIELLTHPRLCDDIAEAGQSFVRENHDWRDIGEQFETLLIGPRRSQHTEVVPNLRGASRVVR